MASWPQNLDWLLLRLDGVAGRAGLSVRRREYDLRLVDASIRTLAERVAPFTMTDPLAVVGLVDALDYLDRANIEGAFVECGVWRGGSSMAAALWMLTDRVKQRELWLYDTFAGMTDPTEEDVRARDGLRASAKFEASRRAEPKARSDWFWAEASLEDVNANLLSTGYPRERIRLVQGPVEDTIPSEIPDRIALLRLDTDWYASTRHELEHLFPRLQPGGILIVDDYHYWRGSRKAVDEYFAEAGVAPFFSRIGTNGAVIAMIPGQDQPEPVEKTGGNQNVGGTILPR
jgi:O-methyltransferase